MVLMVVAFAEKAVLADVVEFVVVVVAAAAAAVMRILGNIVHLENKVVVSFDGVAVHKFADIVRIAMAVACTVETTAAHY
jgi:hypothetical protein